MFILDEANPQAKLVAVLDFNRLRGLKVDFPAGPGPLQHGQPPGPGVHQGNLFDYYLLRSFGEANDFLGIISFWTIPWCVCSDENSWPPLNNNNNRANIIAENNPRMILFSFLRGISILILKRPTLKLCSKKSLRLLLVASSLRLLFIITSSQPVN